MSESSQLPAWQISLLGGVRITDPDGQPVDPGPAKCQELLAALALQPQRAIPVPRLVALLWGDEPPRTAEKTLQTYVGRLRKSLGHEAIARSGVAYRLDLDPETIDTWRFRQALRDGDRSGALDEWSGMPLAGLDSEALQPLVNGLIEEWLGAVEDDLAVKIDEDVGGAVARLTELVSAHPFREGLWALLMTALYRSGRQAEALDAYRRARKVLIEELGVEPGPRLRELEDLVLRQDDRLGHLTRDSSVRPEPAGPTEPPTGTVTFAQAVISDNDRLWNDHPTVATDVVSALEGLIENLVSEHNGYVAGHGPGVANAAFARSSDAINWSESVHDAVATRSWPCGEITIGIGLHTGEAEERDGRYFGPTMTAVDRLAGVAHGGQTIASASTASVDPEARTSVVGTYILDGQSGLTELHQVGSRDFPPPRLARRPGDDLPIYPRRLVGRTELLHRTRDAVTDGNLVTLIGPGGIGKTRLAVETARHQSSIAVDGLWFVSLAEIAESSEVDRAIASAIGVDESDGGNILEAVVDRLRRRTAMLVLDNCEHVVAGAAEATETLAESCPGLTILATSREGLGLAAERLIAVGPISPDDAGVELFSTIARTVDPETDDADHVESIRAICRRLDGVPLAIELAAARSRTLAPDELLARLEDSFRPLTGNRRTSIERHRTLQAAIQWSADLLAEDERLLLRRLAVFAGPFTLEATERIVVDELLVVDDVNLLLGELVDKSMCLIETTNGRRRFRLLEPIRQFLLDSLQDAQHDQALNQRHAFYLRDEIARVSTDLSGPDEIRATQELADLWPNLRAAVDWAIDRRDLVLAEQLVWPIAAQGFLRRGLGDIRDWSERLAELIGPNNHDAIARALLWAAVYQSLNQDRTHFDKVARKWEKPDSPFAHMAHLIVESDHEAIVGASPSAIEEAERQGDLALGYLFEVFVAGNLLSLGRVKEVDAHIADVQRRLGSRLPPTLRNWFDYGQATILAIGGDLAGAEDIYERTALMPLPPRTNSPNESLAARRAFRTGDHRTAFLLLRDHLHDLSEAGNFNGGEVVSVEFANMMTACGRLTDAAMIVGYFDSNRTLTDPAEGFDTLLAPAATAVAADPIARRHRDQVALRQMGPREVIVEMIATLEELVSQ